MGIIINKIKKTFENELFTAENIILNNGIYCFLGKNGTGKTTLLKIICGLENAQKSDFVVDGGILFSPQNRRLFNTDALNNTIIGLKKADGAKALSLFKELQCEELLTKKTATLSGGEISKVCLIRSIMHKKDIMLFDEPFSSCDEASVDLMLLLIKKYLSDCTVIITAHSVKLASKISKTSLYLGDKTLSLCNTDDACEKYLCVSLED